jgi:CheY-like chemotaxis protein
MQRATLEGRSILVVEDQPPSVMNGLASKRGPCVLVVEEEPLLRGFVRSVLGQAGFNVIAASSGHEALSLLKARHDVCAVVSDVSGPDTDNGFELVRRIRKVRRAVGIVLVSGETVPRGGELPYGVLFLSKPFRAVTLLRLLRQLLGSTLPEPIYSSG